MEDKKNEKFESFVNDDDYEHAFESFYTKIMTNFNTNSISDIKSFLNTFENLLRQHICSIQNEENKEKFVEEKMKKF